MKLLMILMILEGRRDDKFAEVIIGTFHLQESCTGLCWRTQ